MANGREYTPSAFESFAGSATEHLGKTYLTLEEIKMMKQKIKNKEEEVKLGIREAKEKRKAEITDMLYKEISGRRKEERKAQEPLRGGALLQQKQAEALDLHLKNLYDKQARGEEISREDLDKLFMFYSYRKSDVEGMPEGGKGKGSPASYLSTMNNAKTQIRLILNELSGKIQSIEPEYQTAVDAILRIQGATDLNTLRNRYWEAKDMIHAAKPEKEDPQIYVETAEGYLELVYAQWADYLEARKESGFSPFPSESSRPPTERTGMSKEEIKAKATEIWGNTALGEATKLDQLADLANQSEEELTVDEITSWLLGPD